jgi:hypothetical protein
MSVTDRLDDALAALVRKPARSDLRPRVLAQLAGAPSPARARWMLAAAMAAAVAIAARAPLAWRSFHPAPTPATVADESPRAAGAVASVGGGSATPVPAATAAAPVAGAHRVAAPPPLRAKATAPATDLAVAPLAAPTAIRIEPIEAGPSAIPSLASDPLVIPPLDVQDGVARPEEKP